MKLFEPLTIKGLRLKNRIVFPPIQLNIGMRSPRARAYYAERAWGGAGTLIVCATSVDVFASDEAWGKPGAVAEFVQAVREGLIQDIHASGAKVGIQLWHANLHPQGIRYITHGQFAGGGAKVAPSAREDMRALTHKEIKTIIGKFGVAAARVQEAGFDFVELHGAHGYLLAQFFSPLENRRPDEYGGSLEGRMRFGLECVAAAREKVGPLYPIFFRLGARDGRPGSFSLEEAIAYARALEKAGVDVLDISVAEGLGARPGPSPAKRYPMGTFVPLAEAIRREVSVSVIAVGRINLPEVAESILVRGQADLVAIGRQLLCDPFWPKKVREGRVAEIVACDSCNINCFSPIQPRRLPQDAPLCKKNPRLGHEFEIPAPE